MFWLQFEKRRGQALCSLKEILYFIFGFNSQLMQWNKHKFPKIVETTFVMELSPFICRFWPMEIWFCLLFELKTTTKKFMHRPTVAWLLTHLAKFNQEMSTYEQVQQSIFFNPPFFDGKSGGNFCLYNKDNVITRLNLQLNTKTVSKKATQN